MAHVISKTCKLLTRLRSRDTDNITPVSSMAFVQKQYWGRHIQIQTLQSSHIWIFGSLSLIIAWHQVAWVLSFDPSALGIRGYLMGLAFISTLLAVVDTILRAEIKSMARIVSLIIVLSGILLPITIRFFVPDLSPDSNTIHYPLALQIFSDINIFQLQSSSLATERIDLGIGSHILAASTMQLFNTSWNFEILNSIAIAVMFLSIYRLCASWKMKRNLMTSLFLLSTMPLAIQQFRIGYQDFFPTCMYTSLALETVGLATSDEYKRREVLYRCLWLSAFAVAGRTTFLAFVIPLLLVVWYIFSHDSAPSVRRSKSIQHSLILKIMGLSTVLFLVPSWSILENATAGKIPKLLQPDMQQLYWSGAAPWTVAISKLDGIALMLVGNTANNPDNAVLGSLFDIPTQAEIGDAGRPDSRSAGGGPLLGEIYTLCITGFILTLLLARMKAEYWRKTRRILMILVAIALPIFILPFNFNYRYFPNYSLLPIVLVLATAFLARTMGGEVRRLVTTTALLMAFLFLMLNACCVGLGVLDQIRSDKLIFGEISQELQKDNTQLFTNNRIGLNRLFGLDVLEISDPRQNGELDDDQWLTDCPSERRVLVIDSDWGVCKLP